MPTLRSRWVRTPTLFALGVVGAYAIARIWVPYWPSFCDGITIQQPCTAVAVQTMTGYLIVALGLAVMILGPIVAALLELAIHGHRWETPRGRETVVTNLPIIIGLSYLVLGVAIAATA